MRMGKLNCLYPTSFEGKTLGYTYSTLSNKRAGWNKVCRLENSAKFGNFKNLKLNWMGLKYF